MDAPQFFEHLRGRLINHQVSLTRLAANSLLVYVDGRPGDGFGLTIWLEPTWNFSAPTGVLAGSLQAQTDDSEEFHKIGESLQVLVGKTIQSLVADPRTFDLTVQFSDDYLLRTFVSDPNSDELWHIRDNATKKRLSTSPKGFAIVEART